MSKKVKKAVKSTKKNKKVESKKQKKTVKSVKKEIKDNKKDKKMVIEEDNLVSASDLVANLKEESSGISRSKTVGAVKVKNAVVIDSDFIEGLKKEIIENEEVKDLIVNSMMKYGMYVCVYRAFPDLEDGLKWSQRRLLYTMYKYGMLNNRAKCQSTIGKVLELNPHAQDYDCLVRMVDTNETLLIPYIKGKGNFGKHYSSELPASPRYTEAMLMPICHEMFDELKRNPENMIDSFDGALKEPRFLSMPYPNVLANSNDGVAVGFASSIPSFNLRELCDASIEIIKNFDKSDNVLYKKVVEKMPTADFSTGGETYIDDEERKHIYLEGYGKIVVRSIFYNDEKNRILEIREMPFSTSIDKIISAVTNAYSRKKIEEVSDIRDESDIKGLRVAIDYKRGTDVEQLKKKLFALTPCQDNFNVNMVMVYNKSPQQIGVISTIKHWIEHRREWLKVVLSHELEELKQKLHLLEGLQKILLDIDKAIKIVRSSKTDAEVIEGLKKTFKLDDIQAEFVADIKLRNLNKDYILNKTKEIKDLKDEIKRLEEIIKSGIDKKIIEDLERVKKQYGVDRKTKIIDKWEEMEVTSIKAPKVEIKLDGNSVVLCGTDAVKRVSEGSSASMQGYKKYTVANSGEILAFTNKCKVFKWNVAKLKSNNITKIADIKKVAKKLEAGEHIIYTMPLIENNKMVVVFENKKAVKFSANAYKTEKSYLCFKKGLNIKNGTPIYIESISEDKDITINGKTINTADIKEVEKMNGSGAKVKI